jgi:hypothetical protein
VWVAAAVATVAGELPVVLVEVAAGAAGSSDRSVEVEVGAVAGADVKAAAEGGRSHQNRTYPAILPERDGRHRVCWHP